MIPKLVKNIATIGISNRTAKGNVTLSKNLKYLSTVNISLNIPSFKESKNGSISLMKMKYPNVKPPIKRRKMAGMYGKEAFLSVGVKPGFIKSHRSEEHTSELQSRGHLVCRLLLEKKN